MTELEEFKAALMAPPEVPSGFSFGDPASLERFRGLRAAVPRPFDLVDVRRLESRLRWRGSWLPWRRRAAVVACRELIRLRERQLGLDRRPAKVFW